MRIVEDEAPYIVNNQSVRAYWSAVAGMGCAVHGAGCPAEIAHCVGKPSVTERIKEAKPKGKKLPRHDWLVIGLCPRLHRIAADALDYNPAAFEARYGPVAGMIDRLVERTGIDVWARSQRGRKST